MKKIILWLLFIFSLFLVSLLTVNAVWNCNYVENSQVWIWANLSSCLSVDDKLIQPKWVNSYNMINWWFKNSIIWWVKKTSIFLSIMAVWSIVYWAFMLTISTWEDEKVKKWKDIVKWWIIGFLAIISAWWLITVLINFMYRVAW